MNLPSFLWLWRIAAWSMGLTGLCFCILGILGGWMMVQRLNPASPRRVQRTWLRSIHIGVGLIMVGLVLLLVGIGIVGTLGHFGSLGHSWHLPAGLIVVGLTLASAWSAFQIGSNRIQAVRAREIHVAINSLLFLALIWVSITGWEVVQKYLPPHNPSP